MSAEAIEQIYNTLQAYDPGKKTICVAGAAIAVHLAEAGVAVGCQNDVDVLCSGKYFDDLRCEAASLATVAKIQLREPDGEGGVRALATIMDIYPRADQPSLLPFSACEAMGGSWYPTYYEECMRGRSELVMYRDRLFLPMAKILLWTAISGREKDIVKVDSIVPVAFQVGLIGQADRDYIRRERDASADLRREHPERYYARAGGTAASAKIVYTVEL
jgi:hypothetical protein